MMTAKARPFRLLALPALAFASLCLSPAPAAARSAVFGGGPFYSGGTAVMNTLRSSGYDTVILWSIHVHANGDLFLNDKLVASNGSYVGNSSWPGQLATLKQAPTSVNRIEVSIGSFGVADFETIESLINSQGTGSSSILFRNFQALKNATGADAADFDDESNYHVTPTVQFANMLSGLGYKITLCPYTNSSFWASVKSQLGSKVDRIYLQVYAGGAGNNPSSWNSSMGMTVDPGLWCKHGSGCTAGDSPSTVQSKMSSWKSSAGIVGGFMWLFDDMQACANVGNASQYATAINNALGGTPPANGVTFYQDINYGGAVSQALAKGSYTRTQLEAKGVPNDWASSMKIPSGWTVIMYQHNNFLGTTWTRSSDTPNFVTLTPNANDQMSSVKIQ
jgi:hypothetical protein